ncbi:hypothetical protein D9Q98_003886 [Chlorella vulgaris]|uniref:Glycosyltransferase n=1 Tax=Chlorella vulgaris TaxID=3077 RepID=A0A9D4YYI2_CHLVU|nr:hypothetical protein D9Q98_003886 [Chlorella vulgaris]
MATFRTVRGQEEAKRAATGAVRVALLLMAGGALAVILAAGAKHNKSLRASTNATSSTPCNSTFDPTHYVVRGSCKTYHKVCFDQGHIVSYDSAFSPSNATSLSIPEIKIDDMQYAWGGAEDNGDKYRRAYFHYKPLPFRYAGQLEESPDLQHPVFSDCTPVVMWSMWIHNYGECLSFLASRMWQMATDGMLSNGTLLSIGTPAGERLRGFLPFMLQPFTVHPVLSFAELSSRTAAPRENHRSSHPYGRCWKTAHLCAFHRSDFVAGLFGAGQAIYEHYKTQLREPPPGAVFDTEDEHMLKVIIDHRNGSTRNLLNWQELVHECNSFAGWTLPPNSFIKRVQCRHISLGNDPLINLAAVRPADVLVAVHGSGCNNWFSMKEGSSLIELRPFQFAKNARDWVNRYFPAHAGHIKHKVHWYGLDIEDPALSQPSQFEQDHMGADLKIYARDRHTTLPFSALRRMLEHVAASGRSRDEYLKLRQAQQYYFELLPGGELKPVT